MEHAIITGGSRGLGQEIASGLLETGYAVSVLSRAPTEFTRGLERTCGDRFRYAQCNIADAESVRAAVSACVAGLGAPFALINNAAIAHYGVLANTSVAAIGDVIAVNLAGTVLVTREVVRSMLVAHRGGRIVSISSIVGSRGYNGLSVYAATKAAVDGLTRSLARELGPRGITVNSVAPGFLDTEMTRGLNESQRAQIVRRTPLGRLATPADVFGVVAFLLSGAAQLMTGQTIVIDGGVSC